MKDKQKRAIEKIYLSDKHPIPRGGMRLKPSLERRTDDTAFEDFKSIDKFCTLNRDVFLNLFSNDQIASKEYDKIFIDIDDPLPKYALMKLITVCDKLESDNIKYTLLQSGSKGYHVYIFFKTVMLSNYRECVMDWLKSMSINEVVDMAAVEPKRVTRIPYSNNTKGGMCIPIGNDGFKVELNPTEQDLTIEINEEFHTIIKKFDSRAKSVRMGNLREGVNSVMFSERDMFPECMGLLVDDAQKGVNLGHVERVEMGKFLLHVFGGDVDKVQSYYKLMSDYKSKISAYQINHLKQKGYKMMNCKSMFHNGLCPIQEQSECPFYPSLNWFIKKERE